MAKLFTHFIFTTRIAKTYNKLDNTTSKLHKSASSIGIIKSALHHKESHDQFINNQDRTDADGKLTLSNLNRHVLTLKKLTHKLSQIDNNLLEQVCHVLYQKLKNYLLNILYKGLDSIKTKGESLKHYISYHIIYNIIHYIIYYIIYKIIYIYIYINIY